MSRAIVSIFSRMGRRSSYNGLNLAARPSNNCSTASATATPPSPPRSHTSHSSTSTPSAAHSARTASSSASASPTNRLSATTTGTPNFCTLRMWRRTLAAPRCAAAGSATPRRSLGTPPCTLRARTVATTIAASGVSPAIRHLMSKNFSAPRSAPNPASVSTTSHRVSASLVATTELQPCAMLPNGPQWMNAGPPSSVCTRLGLIASFKSRVMAPWALRSLARTGRLSRVNPAEAGGEPLLQVIEAGRERQNRHDLRARNDDEPLLARRPGVQAAQPDDDVAQGAVVHVDGAGPRDAARVEAQRVAVMQVGVEHGRQQVVRARDGVEVAREVQVDVLHRDDLRVAAPRGAALHAEHRTQGGLADTERGVLTQTAQGLSDTHGHGRLALARRGRGRPGGATAAAPPPARGYRARRSSPTGAGPECRPRSGSACPRPPGSG